MSSFCSDLKFAGAIDNKGSHFINCWEFRVYAVFSFRLFSLARNSQLLLRPAGGDGNLGRSFGIQPVILVRVYNYNRRRHPHLAPLADLVGSEMCSAQLTRLVVHILQLNLMAELIVSGKALRQRIFPLAR